MDADNVVEVVNEQKHIIYFLEEYEGTYCGINVVVTIEIDEESVTRSQEDII